jgi:hypothetical protein
MSSSTESVLWQRVSWFLATVISAIGALTAYLSYSAASGLSEVQSEDARVDRIYLRVNEAVARCSAGDPKDVAQMKLAIAYMNAAAREFSEHDQKMKLAIAEVAKLDGLACNPALQSEIRSEAKIELARAQDSLSAAVITPQDESGLRLNPQDWRNFDVDVLWCAKGGDAARQLAEAFAKPLLEDAERRTSELSYTRVKRVTADRWKVNNFPEEVNGVQLRFDDENERRFAERVVSIVSAQGVKDIALHPSTQGSRFYLSALVCPGAPAEQPRNG